MIIDRIPPHDDPPAEHADDCQCSECQPLDGDLCRYGHPILADNYCEFGHIKPVPSQEEPGALDKYYLSQRPKCEEGTCMEDSVAIVYEQYSHGAQWPKAVCEKHK